MNDRRLHPDASVVGDATRLSASTVFVLQRVRSTHFMLLTSIASGGSLLPSGGPSLLLLLLPRAVFDAREVRGCVSEIEN